MPMEITPERIALVAAVVISFRKEIIEVFRKRKEDADDSRKEIEQVDRGARDECARIERDYLGSIRGLVEKIHELAIDVVRVQTSLDYLKSAIREQAVSVLHDPHPESAERDALLDKLKEDALPEEEIPILLDKVIELRDDPTQSDGRRLFATLFAWSLQEEQRGH